MLAALFCIVLLSSNYDFLTVTFLGRGGFLGKLFPGVSFHMLLFSVSNFNGLIFVLIAFARSNHVKKFRG